jgi:LPPG:FO 2-phospho-L-lactate transferase
MDALRHIGGESWFLLGDRDLATHVERTRRLAHGETLSEVTRALAGRFGVKHPLAPVSDAVIASVILSGGKRLSFQDYFVREHAMPVFSGIVYEGAETAPLSAALAGVLQNPKLQGVVICPSNPHLSIGPMLAIPALRLWFERRTCKVVAVSPIISGEAVKGPAAKILREMQKEVSPVSIAAYYRGLVDELIIDTTDSSCVAGIAALGLQATPATILMLSLADREALASLCVARCKAGYVS